jgi:transcriptional regulator with XRE-family HTH domain
MSQPARRRSVFPGFKEISDRRGDLLAELASTRRRLGLSQIEVAARMGTSQPAVARLEAGGSDARLSTIERYADALGVALEWRLREELSGQEEGGGARGD